MSCPFVGGLTGDDRKFRKARIFYNRQILEDAVMVLLSSGGVPFLANSASGFMPVGGSGIIEEACGREIFRLSGQTPLEFIREQTGRPLGNTDFGILALAAEVAASEEQLMMRVMLGHNRTSGSIIMAGSIPVGSVVSVSGASRAEMLKAARGCAESLAAFGFKPAAAIVISCVGRKWQFCSCGEEEVQAIQEVIGSEVPLIGFPSFGEIGPFLGNHGSMSPSCFHNATCVICLLGE